MDEDDTFFLFRMLEGRFLGRGVSISKDDIKGRFCFFPLASPSNVPFSRVPLSEWCNDDTQLLFVKHILCVSSANF